MRIRKPRVLRLLTVVGVTLVLIASGVLATVSAGAARGGATIVHSNSASRTQSTPAIKMTAPMRLTRVTKLVTSTPDKNGDVWVQLANGAKVPVPAADKSKVMHEAAEEAKASPDDIKTGLCGESWIFLEEKADDHPVRMVTGFTITLASPAIGYIWYAQISGPHFSYTYAPSGFLDFRHVWNGSYDSPQDQLQGTYKASVSTASNALLEDGRVCYSAGPTAEETLTSPDAGVSWKLSTSGPLPKANFPLSDVTSRPPSSASSGESAGSRGSAPRSGRTTLPQGALTRVKDTTVYPFRAVSLVEAYFPNGKTQQCTGFLYAPNMIATVAHCLVEQGEPKLRAVRVAVVPGSDEAADGTPIHPFRICLGTTAYGAEGYISSQISRYDYAAVKLNCTAGDRTGWFGMRWTSASPTGAIVQVAGYPGAEHGSQWMNSGVIFDSATRQLFFYFDLKAGMSGSPVYTPGCSAYCALAVFAFGPNTAFPAFYQGTRITQAAFDNYQTWKA